MYDTGSTLRHFVLHPCTLPSIIILVYDSCIIEIIVKKMDKLRHFFIIHFIHTSIVMHQYMLASTIFLCSYEHVFFTKIFYCYRHHPYY